ncbi:MAG TPA: glycosyltransferase family 39 protein [Tepidisphaeraceae bacterium]
MSPRLLQRSLLVLILLASFLLKLHHLGHLGLKGLDESFHAVVAKNLLKHPLTPTLIDQPYLPYDHRDWQLNHIWLHKPPLPLWQIALSYVVQGVTTFALRLPSAILATGSVYLTYLIGKRLLAKEAALLAAGLQAFLPALTQLTHGYIFSDHVDTAFLFYTELSIYFLARTVFPTLTPSPPAPGEGGDEGSWPHNKSPYPLLLLTSLATAAAFLSKTYPALITVVIAVTLLFTTTWFRSKHILFLVLTTLLFIFPWPSYCFFRFRQEFLYENLHIFRHLTTSVESFGAPWDRLVFDYLVQAFGRLYPAVLVALILFLPVSIRQRNAKLLFLYAWSLGVLIPHLLATSKTPTATLIGWPALLLLVGHLIWRSFQRDVPALISLFVVSALGVCWPARIGPTGFGYPDPPRFGTIMMQNIWVVPHVVAALLAAVGARRFLSPRFITPLLALALIFLAILQFQFIRQSYRVTQQNQQAPSFPKLAALVEQHLPPNAVLLFDQRQKLESTIALFWIDRTVYPLGTNNWPQLVEQIRGRGGVPLIISSRRLPMTPIFADPDEGLIAYDPADHDLASFTAIYPVEVPLHLKESATSPASP